LSVPSWSADPATIDVVIPAHNEASSIGTTLREFHEVTTAAGLTVRFVVSEDGSSDGTANAVRALTASLPITLLSDPVRKGYSRAAIDGLRAATADLVAFVDGDGQCDPRDLARLRAALDGHDLVVGRRAPRHDHWSRLLISGAFGVVYRALFPVSLRDPSSPYLLIRRPALERVLEGRPGILPQGFWWEFYARAVATDLDVVEVPVRHRARTAGTTQVYRPAKLPRIAYVHLRGLLQLRRELVRRDGGAGGASDTPGR